MAPPKLAGDAPVAQVFNPVEVGLFPVRGNQLYPFFSDSRDELIFEMAHFDEPLLGKIRLDHGFRAIRDAHSELMGLFFHDETLQDPLRLRPAPPPSFGPRKAPSR